MKTIQNRLKEFSDAGARQEKKLRSGGYAIEAQEKIKQYVKKLHTKVEDNRVKYFEVNRAKNIIFAVS
jgi:hypothetical protein